MSLHGAARLLVVAWGRRPEPAAPAVPESLPEIEPGRFAAWARGAEGRSPDRAAPGAACRTADGRPGVLVEVFDGRETLLVCAPA